MADISVPADLWTTSLLPEGILERWVVQEGSSVKAGDPVACVRINESLHEVLSPVAGQLCVMAPANTVVDPGSIIAELRP